MVCEDCMHSSWQWSAFLVFNENGNYLAEQFDFYCKKNDRFFLEGEAPDCTEGIYGENDFHEVCHEYYKMMERYRVMFKKFKTISSGKTLNRWNGEEYEAWIEWLREHDYELFHLLNGGSE